MAFFLDYKILKYSIVNTLEVSDIKKDSQEPYSFIEFVKNLDIDNIENEFIVDSYNKYLVEWTKIKNQATEDFEQIRKNKYVDLLKNIQLNYLNQDEQRILGNIDFDNPLELDVAIPFFVEKIKDIIEQYINKRRDVKNSKAKWSTKGSKQFLENVIAKYIVDNYTKNENTFQRAKLNFQDISDFQRNYRLKYDGLYDLNDYRNEEFFFDPSTFLSSSNDYDLSSLPITSFGDYAPSESTLISEIKKDIYRKYISTDRQYFSGGVGLDINSNTPFYDPYNYDKPFISRIADTTNLLRDSDIGHYFTSKYIYTSNYYSPYGISISKTDKLVGLLPKIDVYRSEDYKDYYFWSKYSSTNQGLIGKPVFDKRLKRFYGYQSRDLNIDDSVGGVERYTDDIQLWTGDKNEIWANEDIFDKFSNNILNRNSKNEFFFVLEEDESVYKYVCDIYGNQYYLIKKINTPESASRNIYTLNTSNVDDSLAIQNISLIGQRFDLGSSLNAIQIQNNVALGFFISAINLENFSIDSITDFGINDISEYPLMTNIFDTENLSSIDFDSQKSIYENQYTEGRVYIRDVNNKHVKDIKTFLGIDIGNIINIDTIDDFIIIVTSTKIYTVKIFYDYSTSKLSFREISKNVLNFYNDRLKKTAAYWYDTVSKSVYFANVDNTLNLYEFYYIEISTNNKVSYLVDDSDIDYNLENLISFKAISKPHLIKNNNFLFLVILLSDTCQNYYYQLLKYEIISKDTLKAISNNIYHPSKLKITNNIVNDVFAISTPELSSYADETFLQNRVHVWNNNPLILAKEVYDLSYNPTEPSSHYDNDDKLIVTIDKPSTKYFLSDIVRSMNLSDPNITSTEDLYSYSGNYIYTPVEIVLDFRNIPNFSSYISQTEPIYKIEYFLNGQIKTKFILSNSEVDFNDSFFDTGVFPLSALAQGLSSTSPELTSVSVTDQYDSVIALNRADVLMNEGVYNNTFQTSPINMRYISFINNIVNFSIKFYSFSGKSFRFDFNFNEINMALSEKYNKVELLDVRIKETDTEKIDCLLYLNTRKPDSIINTSLLNI